MKEYISYIFSSGKLISIMDIYQVIKENVVYQRNIFSFLDLKVDDLSKKNKKLFSEIDLDRFHYCAIPYAWLEKDDRPEHILCDMISNVDSSWQQPNENNNQSLDEDCFEKLIMFCDDLKTSNISSLMLVFDEIHWNKLRPPSKGTYGIYPANSTYEGGYGYLSNCIAISRSYETKKYTVILTCEKHFGDTDIVNKMLGKLGKIDKTIFFCAPENEKERAEWEEVKRVYTNKLKNIGNAISKMEFQSLNIDPTPWQEQLRIERENIIDIKEYIKQYLYPDGWKIRKTKDGEVPIIVSKINGDNEIGVALVPTCNGHQISAILYVYHGIFSFKENINLPYVFIDESNIDLFFKDIQKMFKCLDMFFS